MIRIEITGAEAIQTRFLDLPARLEAGVLRDMAQIVYDTAQRGADAHTKTGRLARSLYVREIPHGRIIGHNLEHAPHALFVHWGTKPHVIERKHKKALRWPSGGDFAFAKRVNHPGYKGDAWLIRAADEAVRQFDAIVTKHLKGS